MKFSAILSVTLNLSASLASSFTIHNGNSATSHICSLRRQGKNVKNSFVRNPSSRLKISFTGPSPSTESDPGGNTVQITELEAELIARNLREMIDLPMVPNPIEKAIVKQVIMAFVEVAPVALPEGMFNQLVSGEQDLDAFNEEFINEINDRICIPIISKDVQNFIVQNVCTVLFSSASTKKVRRQMAVRAMRDSLNANSSVEFATKLNDMIDIPFVTDEKEQKMAQHIVDTASNLFDKLVPEEVREMLQTSSPSELREVRKNLILRLNEMIDIPFKSEAEEEQYIENVVDFLLRRYGLEKGTKFPAEELEDIEHELECVEIQIEAQRVVNAGKEEDFKNKQKSLEKRKKELSEILSKDSKPCTA